MIESKFLKDNIQNIQKLLSIPPLKNFETKSLRQLLRLSKIREYSHGELIIKEGDMDPWLFFLLSGKIRVEKEKVEIGIFDKIGEIFGEMRILDGLGRSASVYAEGKIVCLAVDTSATNRLGSEDEKANFLLLLYRMFAEYVSARLRLTNDELIQSKRIAKRLLKETGGKPVGYSAYNQTATS